jgi:DNA-binding transcriptional MerR regulator
LTFDSGRTRTVGDVSTYAIGEAARRSGFSASALRYYDGIGLAEPVGRTASGYRLYDDDALDRLVFIARTKELGCSLDEITALVDIWDGRRCGPVQRRLHEVVVDKIDDAERQSVDLGRLTIRLRALADQLSSDPVDGPCRPDCACVAGNERVPVDEPATGAIGATPAAAPVGIPIACTLEPGAVPVRFAEWASVLEHAIERTEIEGGLRIRLGPGVDLGHLGRLIGAEQHCCAFFRFALTVDASGIELDVRAPELAADVLTDLFSSAPGRWRPG